MTTPKFLKVMTKIVADMNKEHRVLVPNGTKSWLMPIRADKIKVFFGDEAPEFTNDPDWIEDFAEAYYKLPVAGRAVIALRYGFFSGMELTLGDVHRLTGIDRREVRLIEDRSRQRIYEELRVVAPQEPGPPVQVHVKFRRKLSLDDKA